MDDDVQIEVKSYIGNLHSREVYQRYKMAGASFLVLSIIASGVPLYLLDTQIKKFPRGRNNNQSALAQSDFVDTTLLDWERQGFIKQIPLSEAKAVLPLSVAHRWSHSKKTLKHRLVLDCSPLSGKLSYGRIKLPDLNYLRHQIQKDDFIGLIDITSFYLHFTLQPTFANYLCFEWDFRDGRGKVCFQAVVMLFGIPHAPWIVTMCTDVVVKHIRRIHSISLNPFIDDFSHVAHSELEEALRQFEVAKKELVAWGFVISEQKVVMPARKNTILGYEVDTQLMQIRFDVNKWEEIRFLVEDALQPRVQARYLAKIVGKLFALGYASKIPVACFLPRTIAAIARETEEGDWKSWRKEMVVTKPMHDEMLFLLHNIRDWNGTPIKKPYKIHFYTSSNPISDTRFQPWVGDASKEAAAFYSIRNPKKFAVKHFTPSFAETSSARRELVSIEMLVLEHGEWLEKGSTIVYASDNTSINRWINCGSCRVDVAEVLQKIFLRCLKLQIDLRVTWIPRTHNLLVEADMLSRKDTDEFCLRNRDFAYIQDQFGRPFDLDPFASKFLHKADKFYTKHPSTGSSGTDGLFQPWDGAAVWLFPPRKLLGACINRLFTEQSFNGVLVGLDNAEGLIKLLLYPDGHGPGFVMRTIRFPVKIRMGFSDDLSDAMKNTFTETWHDVVAVFINKQSYQPSLPDRCFNRRGECAECEGNYYVTFDKIKY